MLNERSESDRENGATSPESDILWIVKVRPAHLRDGRNNKSALRRVDIPARAIARFHSKYQKTSAGCWPWTAGCYQNGYGQFMIEHRYGCPQVNTQAHRVAYVLAKGDIPQGRVVMHACDVPACVNPNHLVLGDQADNIADAVEKGRITGAPRKLTAEQIALIQSTKGRRGLLLHKRFGVSKNTISRYRRKVA